MAEKCMTIQAFMKLRGTVIDITHGSSISQSWLTNHFMTHPPDFEISLSPLKLLLSNNNKKKKKKGKKLLLGASFSSESILSKPASTKTLDPGRK